MEYHKIRQFQILNKKGHDILKSCNRIYRLKIQLEEIKSLLNLLQKISKIKIEEINCNPLSNKYLEGTNLWQT